IPCKGVAGWRPRAVRRGLACSAVPGHVPSAPALPQPPGSGSTDEASPHSPCKLKSQEISAISLETLQRQCDNDAHEAPTSVPSSIGSSVDNTASAVFRWVANRVRRRLFAGGRWIRTLGPPVEDGAWACFGGATASSGRPIEVRT